jgi:hypothetical protein
MSDPDEGFTSFRPSIIGSVITLSD